MADIVIIDDETFEVPITVMKRKAAVLDKYAERTVDGNLHRELIGVYFNYYCKFGKASSASEYARLWNKLTEPVPFHTVTVPDEDGIHTYTAYISNVEDEFLKVKGEQRYMKSLVANFIARSPSRI